MEMSPQYMQETAEALSQRGYSLKAYRRHIDDEPRHPVDTYELTRDGREHIILECVLHPEVPASYHLELRKYYALSSFSFPIDSWKLRPDRIEFKFYSKDDTGLGLSLTLQVPE